MRTNRHGPLTVITKRGHGESLQQSLMNLRRYARNFNPAERLVVSCGPASAYLLQYFHGHGHGQITPETLSVTHCAHCVVTSRPNDSIGEQYFTELSNSAVNKFLLRCGRRRTVATCQRHQAAGQQVATRMTPKINSAQSAPFQNS